MPASSTPSATSATSATPSSSSSMTRTPSARPTTSSTSAPPPASMAARSSPRARPRRSWPTRSSLTGQYLSGTREIPMPLFRRPPQKGKMLRVVGATGNNLKNVTAEIPLGLFTAITGVSGGGKSTLLIDTLYEAVARRLNGAREHPAAARAHRGARIPRQGHRHRPVADRPHPALEPGDLYRRLHPDPRVVRRPARGQGPRLPARPLLLQRQGRPLRGLPGRRRHQDRDALPARRLRHLRRLQGQALQPRDAGGAASRASRSPTSST